MKFSELQRSDISPAVDQYKFMGINDAAPNAAESEGWF
jgi:hypothetical protein